MLEDIAIYLLIGICAGLLAGTLGIGSGVFVVPALAFVFTREHVFPDLVMHLAAGTSLATIAVTTTRALIGHLRRHISFWSIYKLLLLGILIGTVGGAVLSHYLHSRTLSIIFGVVLFLLGLKMFFTEMTPEHRKLPGMVGCSSVGLLIGIKSGLLGLGGGAVSTPFLTHYGVSMRQSVVVATAVSLTVSVLGTLIFMFTGMGSPNLPAWSTGYVYWPAWLGVIAGSLIFVPVGVKLSHKMSVPVLRRVFALFLFIASLHMLYVVWR